MRKLRPKKEEEFTLSHVENKWRRPGLEPRSADILSCIPLLHDWSLNIAFKPVVLKLECASESPRRLVKTQNIKIRPQNF